MYRKEREIVKEIHKFNDHFLHSEQNLFNNLHGNILIFTLLLAPKTELDDEGIEHDSDEIDDEKFLDTKELDHILEVSTRHIFAATKKCVAIQLKVGHEALLREIIGLSVQDHLSDHLRVT